MSSDPYKRPDLTSEEVGSFDEWSDILLHSYLREHGNMREMVRHQLDSYEYFIQIQEEQTIQSMNPIWIKSEDDLISPGKYRLELRVYLQNLKSELPHVQESNGEFKLLFPSEARVRNITYSSRQTIQMRLEYLRRNDQGEEIERKTVILPDIFFMNMYVMLRSSLCNTKVFSQLSSRTVNECAVDPGGYFVIKGQEKMIMHHLGRKLNNLVVLKGSAAHKYDYHAAIKYLQEGTYGAAKHLDMFVMSKANMVGKPILISTPRLKKKEYINLFVMFRALGAKSDVEIMHYIFDPLTVDADQREVIEQYLFATLYAAPRDVVDQASAIQHIKNSIEFDTNHYIRDEANERRKLNQVLNMLRDEVFPQYKYPLAMIHSHDGAGAGATLVGATHGRQEKMMMLGYIARQLIWTALGWIEPDSRDSFLNKRMNAVNVIFNDFLRPTLHKVLKTMQTQMSKHFRKERRRALNAKTELLLEPLFTRVNMTKMFRTCILQKQFDKAMHTGDFSTTGYAKRAGYCQQLKRLSMLDTIGHLRRISTTPDKNNEDILENKKYDAKQAGYLCLLETPDTSAVGQLLQLAIGAHSTLFSTPLAVTTALDELAEKMQIKKIGELAIDHSLPSARRLHGTTKLFLNGVWLSVVERPIELYQELKRRKCSGKLHVHTSIVFDYSRNELRISTESGRAVRPMLRMKDGQIMLTGTDLAMLMHKHIQWSDLVTGGRVFEEGKIEFVDAEEKWFSSSAIPCVSSTRGADAKYDYAEFSNTTLQGFCVSQIPFLGMNPTARNVFMANMGKQPMGINVTNYQTRMDRSGFNQMFPGVPIVRNNLYSVLGLNYVPCGKQVNLSLMCYDGSNQEDSMTLNGASADRGLFAGFMFHTEREEDKSVFSEQFIHARPDPATTVGIKDANYSKVNKYCVVDPNTVIHPNDVYLAKTVSVSGVKAQLRGSAAPLYEDQSHVHTRTPEDAYVQSNYVGRGGDGQLLIKTTLRMVRFCSLGDKFATRQAQKVTQGRKVPEFLLPFCADTGMIPDVIYNTHCVPTRMTVAMINEMGCGTVSVHIGAYFNGSQMDDQSDAPFAATQKLLTNMGLDANLQRRLVNPQTGRVLHARVFTGPMFMNKLKHQTIDKAHCRNLGPNVKTVRQPTEGKSRNGGSKCGEMERDVMIGSGCVELAHDRMYACSDPFTVYICKLCGLITAGNNGQEYFQGKNMLLSASGAVAKTSTTMEAGAGLIFRKEFRCRLCENRNQIALVEIPYAYKLHIQEMMSINVVPRIVV